MSEKIMWSTFTGRLTEFELKNTPWDFHGLKNTCSFTCKPTTKCIESCVYFTEFFGFRFLTRVPMGNYLPVWALYNAWYLEAYQLKRWRHSRIEHSTGWERSMYTIWWVHFIGRRSVSLYSVLLQWIDWYSRKVKKIQLYKNYEQIVRKSVKSYER